MLQLICDFAAATWANLGILWLLPWLFLMGLMIRSSPADDPPITMTIQAKWISVTQFITCNVALSAVDLLFMIHSIVAALHVFAICPCPEVFADLESSSRRGISGGLPILSLLVIYVHAQIAINIGRRFFART